MHRQLLTAVALALSLTAVAQNYDDGWGQPLRPEPFETTTRVGTLEGAALTPRGVRRVPVVLVGFQDRRFSVADSDSAVAAFYDRYCNGSEYTGHGSRGSIRDYFIAQSDSLFLPEFSIIGPVTLDGDYASYGRNSGSTKDVGYRQFREEACQKAAEAGADWTLFDNDQNGTVDMVFFIYAGWGESNTQGLDPDAIWAKESTAATTIGNLTFATSAACHELRVNTAKPLYDEAGRLTGFDGWKADGIGVFVHELSHALGLPDFYDTRGVAFGMDLWSVMDYGEYGNNGYTPGAYTAYERDFMGWAPLDTLVEPQVVTLPTRKGYKILNDANPDEYYVIENRQQEGWDEAVCSLGHGLQVTHVDYNRGAWIGNTVNTNKDHQRMTIIAANNNYTGTNAAQSPDEWLECLAGNLYPGQTYNYNLTDETTPASVVYTGDYMHKPLRNITENEDGTITLCFRTNGRLDAPQSVEVSEVSEHTFRAAWSEVEHATRYVVEMIGEGMPPRLDTLAATTTTYDSLPDSRPYQLRVKALADSPEDYIESEWSDTVYTMTLVDGIINSKFRIQNSKCFDLQGRRVARPARRGIYIVNRKKTYIQ